MQVVVQFAEGFGRSALLCSLAASVLFLMAYRGFPTGWTKKLLILGLVISTACGLAEAGGEILIAGCEESHREQQLVVDCRDYGGTAMQVMFIAGFWVTAAVVTFNKWPRARARGFKF